MSEGGGSPPGTRTGVADYFAVIGVGDSLIWKHTQKQQQQQQQQQEQNSAESSIKVEDTTTTHDIEQEDLLERFYREIVEVAILVEWNHHHSHNQELGQQQQQQHTHQPSVVLQHSDLLSTTPSQESLTLATGQDSSDVASAQPSISTTALLVPLSPSISETTSILQVEASTTTMMMTTTDIPTTFRRHDGWNVLKRTLPSAGAVLAPPSNKVSQESSPVVLYQPSTVWDANLDWIGGLGAVVQTRHQQHVLESHSKKQAALTGLRQKVESTIKQFQHLGRKPHHEMANPYKYHVAFARRSREEDSRRAIADVELFYVRLHYSNLPHATRNVNYLPSPASGLAGHFFERYQSQTKFPPPEEESNLVNLRDYLALPDGFEEWSIPEEYQWIRDPQTVVSTSPRKDHITTTVLFDHNQFHADDLSTPTSSAAGVEAMDASSDVTLPTDPTVLFPKLLDAKTAMEGDRNFRYIPVLAIRRQRVGDEERYHEDPAIVELAVTFFDRDGLPVLPRESCDWESNDEDEGDTFNVLGKSKWTRGYSIYRNGLGLEMALPKPFGTPTLLVRRNLPYGFADAAFATRVLGRFPLQNYKSLPLPEEELPMFCYPNGCRLHRAKLSDAPVAQYYGFVVKNERGDSIYVSCVSFMEPLTPLKSSQLEEISMRRSVASLPHRRYCEKKQKNRSMSDETVKAAADPRLLLTSFDEMITFENKTICLVSRFPFWTAFRKFLLNIHVLSGAPSLLPIERHISHLLLSVPLPKPGGPSVLVPLAGISEPMILSIPPEKDFPLVDLPYQRLFACLDVKRVVTIVLGLLALERKLIVMSTRPSLVLDVCELLRSLLFPFDLCAPYVPRLTEPFKSSLDFPGAIFVGIHDDGLPNGLASLVKKNCPEETIIIDLDTGGVDCDGDRFEVMNRVWETLPLKPRSALVSELEALCRDASIIDGHEPLDSQYDNSFDVTLSSAVDDLGVMCNATKEPFDDRAARDAFLRFFCSILGGYERFLVVPDADFLVSGNEWFDAKGFLASVPDEHVLYLNSLVSTQLFQSFIQRRTEASDVHCLLFDECIAEFHAATIPYGRLGGDAEVTGNVLGGAQPHILYSLLVDQSATPPHHADTATLLSNNRSFDTSEGESESALNISKLSISLAEQSELQFSECAVNTDGDLVTAPTHEGLPRGTTFIYCVNGNPCFPHIFETGLFLPQEPESWLLEFSKRANPVLARSEREVEEANRRRRLATSYSGLQGQRRCFWQLPKIMGSHFLGTWLLCIPALVSQPQLTHEQQSRFLLIALGALRVMRSKHRIVPDEAAYRALMVACGRNRSDRRVELVKLFGLLRSDGIFPSAVTLGQYTKALAEGYSKHSTSPDKDNQMDRDGDLPSVEVTESGSRVGRCSFSGPGNRNDSSFERLLHVMDPSLTYLEEQGRRWRQRSIGGQKDDVDEGDKKKRSTAKSWFPVVFTSSFAPQPESIAMTDHDIRFVSIWSRTRGCPSCSYIPLEEEVQAGWDVVGGEHDIPGSILCPRCGSLILPMLGFRELSFSEALCVDISSSRGCSVADFSNLPPQIRPIVDSPSPEEKVEYVTYTSPTSLRLALEQYVEEFGEEILDREKLKQLNKEVYYNFLWNCARFSLPFPLPTAIRDNGRIVHYCVFSGWEKEVADRGCFSAAKVLVNLKGAASDEKDVTNMHINELDSGELTGEMHLLSRFNLQGYYSAVWDHSDISKILVALVEACDKRDFRPVIESVLKANLMRREHFKLPHCDGRVNSVELDIYRIVIYLAKYQCTTAFHAFFPTTSKACKGYHYWCAIGTPSPAFDRLLKDGEQRLNNKETSDHGRVHIPSEVALGFRCVFGHLI